MVRVAVFVFFTLCSACLAFAEEASNNCHDPASWADWEERVAKHPQDQELHLLHALWMGLCVKVEKGDIPFAEAIDIFENARETLIQQRQEQHRLKKNPAPL
jgi:hypothetical protein